MPCHSPVCRASPAWEKSRHCEPCTGPQGQGTVTDIHFNAGIYTPTSSFWDPKKWVAFPLQTTHFAAASSLQERNFHAAASPSITPDRMWFHSDHSYSSTHKRNITGFVNGLNQNNSSNYCLHDRQKKNCYSVGYIRYDSFNLGHHSTSSWPLTL